MRHGWLTAGLAVTALALASCAQPPMPLNVTGRDGAVIFTPAWRFHYFLIPHRPPLALSRIDIWQGDRWVWRIRAEDGQGFALPVRYGELPVGAKQLVPPQPLKPGQTYRFYVEEPSNSYHNAVLNSFVLRQGRLRAASLPFTPDPDLQAGLRAEQARIDELVATGMSREAAKRALIEEQRLASPYP